MTDRVELQRLVEAATPGPWLAVVGTGAKRRVQQTAMVGVADMRGQGAAGCLAVLAGLNKHRADDAEFIAAARAAVPELLDVIARLEALCECYPECGCGGDRASVPVSEIRAAIKGGTG